MLLRQVFDDKLAQYAYLIGCQATGEALLVDPQRDVDRYIELAEAEGLSLTAVAETHIHADFLSGARELAERLDVELYLSAEGGEDWQVAWADGPREAGGAYRVTRLRHGDTFRVGNIEVRALHTPGHTPEHMSFLVVDRGGDATTPLGIATGDFVFVGDLGRPDLLEQAAGIQGVQDAAARTLFRALPTFLELDDHLQVWPGHGAGSACGKALGAVPVTTVGYERRYNASVRAADAGEDAFVRSILADQPEPQTYFARMKRQNREGPPLLGDLPRPRRLGAQELQAHLADPDVVVIDTRLDRAAALDHHLPGALYAPLDRSFNTVVGSLVEDETRPLLLVVEEDDLEEAVRDLVRIGYDRLDGFLDPATLERHFEAGGTAASVEAVDFGDVAALRDAADTVVVDVRSGGEYRSGHVPGAVHLPYTRLPLLEDRLPAEGTLVVHCQSGARAAAASAWLSARGRDVRWVDDDFDAWVDAGGDVETGSPSDAPVAAGAGEG